MERAQLEDLDALVKLEYCVFNPSDGLLSRRAFRHHLRSNNLLLVAKESRGRSELLGYILVLNRKLSARIYSLAINPDFQRRGVAKTLVKRALTESIVNQLFKVNLETRVTNVKALNLYKSLGFQEKHIRSKYYGDNEDACCMEWNYEMTNKASQRASR